ncbi:hypothetical protein JZ751_028822 [Albula glossodonta]|uniref:Uncharacterized protein n=1 Tax=Albula glossodonta TaxID=121402 RepID=A0A8T2NER7_9TELE|nr:hypothetical protein JZ751_028822 [Albula glossodonta]
MLAFLRFIALLSLAILKKRARANGPTRQFRPSDSVVFPAVSMSRSRSAPAKGQGAARARQMGLLLDLDGGADIGGDDGDLEAELLNLIGDGGPAPGKKEGGRAPVPMADIERMAALCMKDLDEDEEDDGDLESDADLLAELNDVLEDEEEEEKVVTPPRPKAAPPSIAEPPRPASGSDEGGGGVESLLKGKPISEADIPPPVATGGKPAAVPQPEPAVEHPPPEPTPTPTTNEKPLQEAPPVASKPRLLTPPQKPSAITPDTPLISPLTPSQPDPQHSEAKSMVLSRQREYKLAAIQAKQSGDTALAKRHYLIAKVLPPCHRKHGKHGSGHGGDGNPRLYSP